MIPSLSVVLIHKCHILYVLKHLRIMGNLKDSEMDNLILKTRVTFAVPVFNFKTVICVMRMGFFRRRSWEIVV